LTNITAIVCARGQILLISFRKCDREVEVWTRSGSFRKVALKFTLRRKVTLDWNTLLREATGFHRNGVLVQKYPFKGIFGWPSVGSRSKVARLARRFSGIDNFLSALNPLAGRLEY
jgi:hypothetical protein